MENVATPEVPVVTPPATPATPAAPATPVAPATETVTLSKDEADQLRRDAARAASNQRKADLFDKLNPKGNGHFKPSAPATPPSPEEMDAAAKEEDRKAEQGVLRLALDPVYREVLDKDPTLRDLLTKNPLAVLPILAPDAIDAEDAVNLVKEALDKRKTPATPPAAPATPPATPPTPPAGGINPHDAPVNEEVEAARKLPNTEQAIAGMVGAKLKIGKK